MKCLKSGVSKCLIRLFWNNKHNWNFESRTTEIAQYVFNQHGNRCKSAKSATGFFELFRRAVDELWYRRINYQRTKWKIPNYQAFKLLPNPSAGNIFYNGRILKKFVKLNFTIQLEKIMSKYDLKEHTDKFSLSLDGHSEPNACYFIRVLYQDGGTEVKKDIITKTIMKKFKYY